MRIDQRDDIAHVPKPIRYASRHRRGHTDRRVNTDEVVEHGVDGYLVEPGDVKRAGAYAIEILSRADRGREMGHTARLNAKQKFCANDVIPQYERYYQRVLESAAVATA